VTRLTERLRRLDDKVLGRPVPDTRSLAQRVLRPRPAVWSRPGRAIYAVLLAGLFADAGWGATPSPPWWALWRSSRASSWSSQRTCAGAQRSSTGSATSAEDVRFSRLRWRTRFSAFSGRRIPSRVAARTTCIRRPGALRKGRQARRVGALPGRWRVPPIRGRSASGRVISRAWPGRG
jgi:hypothetical protein